MSSLIHLHGILEEAHLSVLKDLHPWIPRQRYCQLQRRIHVLQHDSVAQPRAPVQDHAPRAARSHPVEQRYSALRTEELQRRSWRMATRPQLCPAPAHGPFYIIHLYAGRRRELDFHHHMQSLLDQDADPL